MHNRGEESGSHWKGRQSSFQWILYSWVYPSSFQWQSIGILKYVLRNTRFTGQIFALIANVIPWVIRKAQFSGLARSAWTLIFSYLHELLFAFRAFINMPSLHFLTGYAYPDSCIILLEQENILVSVQNSEFPRQCVLTKGVLIISLVCSPLFSPNRFLSPILSLNH